MQERNSVPGNPGPRLEKRQNKLSNCSQQPGYPLDHARLLPATASAERPSLTGRFLSAHCAYCHRVGSLIHSRSRLPQAYANPTTRMARKTTISMRIKGPAPLRITAQGKIKTVSISKIRKTKPII